MKDLIIGMKKSKSACNIMPSKSKYHIKTTDEDKEKAVEQPARNTTPIRRFSVSSKAPVHLDDPMEFEGIILSSPEVSPQLRNRTRIRLRDDLDRAMKSAEARVAPRRIPSSSDAGPSKVKSAPKKRRLDH